MAGSPYREHVSFHTPAEIRSERMVPLLAHGGKAGLLVWDHGDGRIEATGLFTQSGVPGAGRELLRDAVENHGVNYVECYGPALNRLYEQVGFRDTEVFPFDRSQAAPGWDDRRFDSPDYHLMSLPAGSVKALTTTGWPDEHWDDPAWVEATRARVEAGYDPAWRAANADRLDDHWAAALAAAGVTGGQG